MTDPQRGPARRRWLGLAALVVFLGTLSCFVPLIDCPGCGSRTFMDGEKRMAWKRDPCEGRGRVSLYRLVFPYPGDTIEDVIHSTIAPATPTEK